MGRFSANTSYGHRVAPTGFGDYRISWVVDRYYSGSRLRFPTVYSRYTDHKGAVRFAKRHDLALPPAQIERLGMGAEGDE